MKTSQSVLVVSGTSGMGRATAEPPAARGDNVIVGGRDAGRVAGVASQIGGKARGVAIDPTDEASIQAAAEAIGDIDQLVLSAAALTYAPFKELTVELAPVRVNAVSPGVVDTEGLSHLGEDRQTTLDSAGAALPVGRVGRPADVASTVVHLIDNGFTTGTIHHVDGGARLV